MKTTYSSNKRILLRLLSLMLVLMAPLSSCREILEPPPVDLQVDELVLNAAADVEPIRLGLYSAFRGIGSGGNPGMASPMIIAGDFTADFLQFRGTFTVYNELANKRITAANDAAEALWNGIFRTIYVANFIEERLAEVPGVTEANRKQVLAEARFMRGLANFIGAYTFGGIPKVTTTTIATNRTIPKATREEILSSVLADLNAALTDLPNTNVDRTLAKIYATKNAARAALARYYLYQRDWAQAEKFASEIIATRLQTLPESIATVFFQEFDDETIFEVAFANNSSDDPQTNTFGLNNVLVGRREVIPANTYVVTMLETNAGERRQAITFDPALQRGRDNGWSVDKYSKPDDSNNNITIFRLAEQYLIRAEARAQQGRLVGANGAQADINVLRRRAKAPNANITTQADALLTIEKERVYELSFEGHRWYDLKRTGRILPVMTAFSPDWNDKFNLWPIPQSEIQRNDALSGAQNPGY